MTPMVEHRGSGGLDVRAAGTILRYTGRPLMWTICTIGDALDRRVPTPFRHLSFGFTDFLGVFLPGCPGTTVTPVSLPKARAEWITSDAYAAGTPGPTVLYFPGGGFLSCGLRTHRRMVGRIAMAAGGRALSVDYRLLPKHTIEDAVADAVDGYQLILDSGVPASEIVVAGDSAGGYLAARVIDHAISAGLPVPSAMALIGPVESFDPNLRTDTPGEATESLFPRNTFAALHQVATRGGWLATPPAATELRLSQFPPTLIQVGSGEVLRADAEDLVAALRGAGVPARLQIWQDAPHVFQVAGDLFRDAREAINELGGFIRTATAGHNNIAA